MRALVVVTDPIHPDGIAHLEATCDVFRFDRNVDETARANALSRAEALVIRSFPLNAGVIAHCARLRAVGKHGAGVDNVDIPALSAAGIPLANTPGASNATAVSEGAVSMMLAALRRIPELHEAVRTNNFDVRFGFRAGDLWEQTLGIVGIGNIGTHVARICGAGFKMRVLAYDPYLSKDEIAARGAEKIETLGELLRMADVVTVHTPLTKETHHIIGRKEFALMKPTAILVNTSRGPTVDPDALYEVLATSKIRGAAIDVFDPEPPLPGTPLLDLPNVVLSPHNAGLTEESTRQMALRTADVAMQMLAGRKPESILNPEVWDRRRTGEPATAV